jgi:hypothetical protein
MGANYEEAGRGHQPEYVISEANATLQSTISQLLRTNTLFGPQKLIYHSRPTLRYPHLRTHKTKHQENLPRRPRRHNRHQHRCARPLQRTNPPLRKRQPRMRTRRRHPPRTPTHRRSLLGRLYQHPAPRHRHRHSATRPAYPRGRGDVVQSLQSVGRGYRGCAARGQEGEKSEVDVYAHC